MENQSRQQQQNSSNAIPFLAGMLAGGLAGAAMLLSLGARSGRKTRAQTQQAGADLRDQADETEHVKSNEPVTKREQVIYLIPLPRCPLLDMVAD